MAGLSYNYLKLKHLNWDQKFAEDKRASVARTRSRSLLIEMIALSSSLPTLLLLALLVAPSAESYSVTGTTVGPGHSRPEGIKLNLVAGAYLSIPKTVPE